MQKFVITCIALVMVGALTHAQQTKSPTAAQILSKVASVYAGCRAYSDEGETNIGFAGMPARQVQRFRTAFERPARFRFELWLNRLILPPGNSYIVWKDGEVNKSWTPFGVGEKQAPLDTALIRLAPQTAGTSLIVPQLLLPDLFRVSSLLASLDDLKLAGEDKIDGHEAFRIEGSFPGQTLKIWIDKQEYLILKSYRRVNLGGLQQESTTYYKPQLNSEVRREGLAFKPPTTSAAGTAAPKPSRPELKSSSTPALAPRLRDFGSSLSQSPTEKAIRTRERPPSEEDTVRIDTDLVVCAILVVDQHGKIIRGLTKEDFIVKEDNKLQEAGSFSLGDSKDIPRSIVLIIDYSGSQLPYIKTSVEAAKTLVDKLNPKDRMALVTDDVKLLVDFTSDKELLKGQLDSLKASAMSGNLGASEQYDALLASLNELFDVEDVRPIIIFQTDGDELDSLKGGTPINPYMPPRKFSLDDILTATEKARATVYSIISGVQFAAVPEGELVNRAKLDWSNREDANVELRRTMNLPVSKSAPTVPSDDTLGRYARQWQRRQLAVAGVAKFTGAWAEFLEQPNQADEIYTRVLTDLDRRYIIGYYPTNRHRDGKRRNVSIEVRGHPEYIVWGRKTYFAPEPE